MQTGLMNKQSILLMMMIMMICFCGIVDRQKAFSLMSIWDHCQRSSPSRIATLYAHQKRAHATLGSYVALVRKMHGEKNAVLTTMYAVVSVTKDKRNICLSRPYNFLKAVFHKFHLVYS